MEALQGTRRLDDDPSKRKAQLEKLSKELDSKIRASERRAGRSLEDLQVLCGPCCNGWHATPAPGSVAACLRVVEQWHARAHHLQERVHQHVNQNTTGVTHNPADAGA